MVCNEHFSGEGVLQGISGILHPVIASETYHKVYQRFFVIQAVLMTLGGYYSKNGVR